MDSINGISFSVFSIPMSVSVSVTDSALLQSTNVPLKYFTVAFTPRVVLYYQTQSFTGLRFEVEQASRGLSAIAELLVCLRVVWWRRMF